MSGLRAKKNSSSLKEPEVSNLSSSGVPLNSVYEKVKGIEKSGLGSDGASLKRDRGVRKILIAATVTILVFIMIGVVSYKMLGGPADLAEVILMSVAGMMAVVGMFALGFTLGRMQNFLKQDFVRGAAADKVSEIVMRPVAGVVIKVVMLLSLGIVLWGVYELSFCTFELPPRNATNYSDWTERQEYRNSRCEGVNAWKVMLLGAALIVEGGASVIMLLRRMIITHRPAEIKELEWSGEDKRMGKLKDLEALEKKRITKAIKEDEERERAREEKAESFKDELGL